MSRVYSILEGLKEYKEPEYVETLVSNEREAVVRAELEKLMDWSIVKKGNDVYLRYKVLKKSVSGKNKRSTNKGNNTGYKGLEDLTDTQIGLANAAGAIIRKSDGTYYVDWYKVKEYKKSKRFK